MNRIPIARNHAVLFGICLLITSGLFVNPKVSSFGSKQEQSDNTKKNRGDASKDATTADQERMNPGDHVISQKIRAVLMKDKSLSTYAHNVKIIAQDGKVTLKGPVRTPSEETTMEEKAAAIAGKNNVTSQIEITPPKS